MKAYQKAFIEFALEVNALKFGEFTLKSGRTSPYFFNMALFNRASHLSKLSRFYAQAIIDNNLSFDVLFGPAYKGIPLASTTAVALKDHHQFDCGVIFNRKEVKTHGEGGTLVGSELEGKVLILDDLITAGTAIREVIEIVQASKAELSGIIVAIDRQERGQGQYSAMEELTRQYTIPVISIIKLEQLIDFVSDSPDFVEYLDRIESYRAEYGA